jgi:hypothetical protein
MFSRGHRTEQKDLPDMLNGDSESCTQMSISPSFRRKRREGAVVRYRIRSDLNRALATKVKWEFQR